MAVSSLVILVALFSSVLQVDGSYSSHFYYPLVKVLETALMTDENLYTMRQVFFPVVRVSAQEVQQVRIRVSVEITVDLDMNSTANNLCKAGKQEAVEIDKENNVSLHWKFRWTNSALLSLITIDELASFDSLSTVIYSAIEGPRYFGVRDIDIFLPIICSEMPEILDVRISSMLLFSWSKSYARYRGLPSQWDEADKGYIQEYYGAYWYYLAESTYNGTNAHLLRVLMIVSFILLNILVLIVVLSYGQTCYRRVHLITSTSTTLAAVTWALMITAMLMNSLYILYTINGLLFSDRLYPGILTCFIADAYWCDAVKSTKLYSDEVVSLLVKLILLPFTIAAELIIAVRLTGHTLLPFPCSIVTTSQCCSFRNGKRIIEIILIWNVMVSVQVIFGVTLIPVGMLMVISPVTTILCITFAYLLIPLSLVVFIAYSFVRCCNPISLRRFCSIFTYARLFTAIITLSMSYSLLILFYVVVSLGVEPWSVKGSVVTLLPSFLVTPLLWFVKRYSFKKDRSTDEVEQINVILNP